MKPIQRERKGLIKARRNEFKTPCPLFLMGMSFLVPILLLLPAFIYLGIFPFGNFTTLAVDLRNQYVGFYEAYKGALQDPGSLLYNFTKGAGGVMTGTDAYYLMSPFNLLFFFVPSTWLPIAIEVSQVLKIGFSGLFFSLYLIKRQHGEDWRVLLFSVLYALMSYSMANLINLMWLDPVMLAPLVLIQLENMLEGKSPIPYILILALVMITNFYIAYMLCLFLIFFTIWTLIRLPRPRSISRKGWLLLTLRRFGRFVFCSLIAGMIVAWLLLPTIYSLAMSKGPYQQEIEMVWEWTYALPDPFSRLLPAAFDYDEVSNGFANIYSGTIAVIMGIFYFLNRRIAWRERITSFLLLAFLLLSMNVRILNLLWHGLQYPVWYNYRFSWIFTLFVLIIGFRSMIRMRKCHWLQILGVLLSYGALLGYLFIKKTEDEEAFPFLTVIHLAATLFLVVAFLFLLKRITKSRRGAPLLLLLLSFLEVSVNAAFYLSVFNYESLSEFTIYDEMVNDALSDIRPKKNEFYRIEKTFMHDSNDGMRFQYSGLTHFNSTYEYNSVEFLSSLGFARARASTSGGNATKLTDALFGIRYYLVGKYDEESAMPGMRNLKSKSYRPDVLNMKKVKETPYITVYENPWAMPFGMVAESDLKDYEVGRKNPMDLQDDIANLLDGKSQQINYFVRQPLAEPTLQNLTEQESASELKQFVRSNEDESESSLNYTLQTYGQDSAYLTISETFDSSNSRIYLNGEEVPNKRTGDVDSSQILNVAAKGEIPKTQEFSIAMAKDTDSFRLNNVALFELDEQALQDAVSFQNRQGLKLSQFQSTHWKGTFEAAENTPYLLLSLPYDMNWTAKLDGQEVTPFKVFDALTAVAVSPGTHTIEMDFHIPLLVPLVIVTLVGLIGFVIVLLFFRGTEQEQKLRFHNKKG